jgi:hypothetical protein
LLSMNGFLVFLLEEIGSQLCCPERVKRGAMASQHLPKTGPRVGRQQTSSATLLSILDHRMNTVKAARKSKWSCSSL